MARSFADYLATGDAIVRTEADPSIFEDALHVAVERLSTHVPPQAQIEAELAQLKRELTNLATAIASAGHIPTLNAELHSREARRRKLEQLAGRGIIDADGLRKELRARLDEWRGLLRSRPTHGQQVLKKLLKGPILIGEPTESGVPWRAQGQLAGVFATLSTSLTRLTRAGRSGSLDDESWQLASPGGYAHVGAPQTFIEGDIAA